MARTHLRVLREAGLVDDRPALIFERRLAHSVERVWRAITEPDELRHWSPGVPDWTLEPGARFGVEGAGDGSGEILELDPGRLLAFDWGGQYFRCRSPHRWSGGRRCTSATPSTSGWTRRSGVGCSPSTSSDESRRRWKSELLGSRRRPRKEAPT